MSLGRRYWLRTCRVVRLTSRHRHASGSNQDSPWWGEPDPFVGTSAGPPIFRSTRTITDACPGLRQRRHHTGDSADLAAYARRQRHTARVLRNRRPGALVYRGTQPVEVVLTPTRRRLTGRAHGEAIEERLPPGRLVTRPQRWGVNSYVATPTRSPRSLPPPGSSDKGQRMCHGEPAAYTTPASEYAMASPSPIRMAATTRTRQGPHRR